MTNLNYNFNNKLILVFIISLIYILSTNIYFSIEESFIFGGADGLSYLQIAKASPNIANEFIQPIHSERFIISYLIGFLGKIVNVENYKIFRFTSIVSILVLNYLLFKIIFSYNISLKNKTFAILLIVLNPYITRFYISNPLIINDLIFHIGALISILSIKLKNKKIFYLGLIVSIIARQSGVAIFLSAFFVKIIMKQKFFLKKKDLFYSFLIMIFLYFIGYFYSLNTIAYAEERYDQYYVTIFGIFLENKSWNELLIFFTWPFLCLLPLIIFNLLFLKIEKNLLKKNLIINLFILSFCLLVIFQPILQGIDVSGKNIIRLSSFAFIPLLIFGLINSINYKNNIIKNTIFILIVFLWSSHPTFSIFSFLESFKF